MNSRIASPKKPQFVFLLSLFAFVELSISGWATLLINPDPKSAFLFGYSATRLILVAGIWILAITILVLGVMVNKKIIPLDTVWLVGGRKYLRLTVHTISAILIAWAWLSLLCPPYLFGRFIYFYERLRPFSIALGASLAQFWLFFLFSQGRLDFRSVGKPAFQKYFRPTIFFTVILAGLGIFIASSKFGLLANLIFSNVPGIPLSSLQLFFILLLVGIWITFVPGQQQDKPLMKIVRRYRLIPILVFLSAVMTWGFTPMLRHFFSLNPAAPSYQPFPYSDARVYDLGGISILQGYGSYFYGLPLYMIFLAILHFFAGFNYTIMTWLQILVLAFIPVFLFLLGEKFHSTIFGIFLSLVTIIRQRNAIVLSYKISSVNPRLFMTEEMTLLGVALLAYLVFLWLRERKIWLAFLCGGCIGATSLLRLNPIFLFPAVACLIILAFWRMGKKFLFKHLSSFTLAFLILLIPWIFSSFNQKGTPWLFIKLQLVINERYRSIESSPLGFMGNIQPEVQPAAAKLDGNADPAFQSKNSLQWVHLDNVSGAISQNTDGISVNSSTDEGRVVYRFMDHLFHNFTTSVLSMPDSLVYDDLGHLSQRVYWSDAGGWKGDLPAIQIGLIFLNIFLISLGLGYSWVHHRWAGMIPLVIFISYSVSLSAAMSSGGRYLTPMDWVLYFYYGLAIVAIIQFFFRVFGGRGFYQTTSLVSSATSRSQDRRILGFVLAGIIVMASLIPIANFVLPIMIPTARERANMEAVRQSITAREAPGENIIYGNILYPYYEDGTMTFDFLSPTGVSSYSISRVPEMRVELTSGEHAYIALQSQDVGNPQVESIYLYQEREAELIWKRQP